MRYTPLLFFSVVGLWLLSSCATIRPGEVGMKQTFGKLEAEVYEPGLVGFNPIGTRIVKVPTRTVNREVVLNLPSKDGLNVRSEISILYRINGQKAPKVVEEVGLNYEEVVILSVFRSAAADVCSRFLAKDMYTASRVEIEKQIQAQMQEILQPRGFEIENVLMKSIQLPTGLVQAIEDKLEAEQNAQQMTFELQREELEAQRKIIEAKGIRDAQKIIEAGLTEKIIQWQTIDAFKSLASAPGSRLIITDGKAPLLINEDMDE
ncbi:MAG: prohibitin family protein [Bacteroidota bacterium]